MNEWNLIVVWCPIIMVTWHEIPIENGCEFHWEKGSKCLSYNWNAFVFNYWIEFCWNGQKCGFELWKVWFRWRMNLMSSQFLCIVFLKIMLKDGIDVVNRVPYFVIDLSWICYVQIQCEIKFLCWMSTKRVSRNKFWPWCGSKRWSINSYTNVEVIVNHVWMKIWCRLV